MKQDQQVLETQQRRHLQAPVAPEGLWERIEQAVQLQGSADSVADQQGAPVLGEASRFQLRFRFAAAGLLGFLVFFGLEQVVTREAGGVAKASLAASGLHLVDHLREEVPLVHNPASYVEGMQGTTPWPEVTLATYISNNEAN